MGLFSDIGNGLKKVGGGAVDLAGDVGGALVNEDAWSNVVGNAVRGDFNKINGEDLMNVLLDASILVPGAGVAGMAARGAVKTGTKLAAREGSEALARKATVNSLRSTANQKARAKVGTMAEDAKSLVSGARSTAARSAGRNPAVRAKQLGPGRPNQLQKMAGKQGSGVGKRVGMGQSRKRVLANTALVGGANALETNYESLKDWLGGDGDGNTNSAKEAANGGPMTINLTSADGQDFAVGPQALMDAMAAFIKQNGTVDGAQVFYNK